MLTKPKQWWVTVSHPVYRIYYLLIFYIKVNSVYLFLIETNISPLNFTMQKNCKDYEIKVVKITMVILFFYLRLCKKTKLTLFLEETKIISNDES